MIKIKVKKLQVHNFLSFKDNEWDFDKTSRLVLIKGINKDTESTLGNTSNGSGKSSLANALMFALFGQLIGKSHVSNLKNKYCDDALDGFKMFVDIEVDTILSKDDVKHWRIRRGMQKGQSVTLQLFTLDEDGEWKEVSKSTSANSQQFIEDNVVMMNFEMYQRLVMLSIEDKYNFFKLNAAQKREFIETMFDTEVYSKMFKMMGDDIKSLNMMLQNLKVNQIKLQKNKELCEDEIEKYKSRVNERIDEAKTEKEECQKKIDGFAPKFDEFAEQKKTIKESLDKIRSDRTKLEDVISKVNSEITDIRIDINDCNAKISSYEKELDKHKEVLGMICDDCKQIVNKFYSLDVYREEIDKLRSKIDTDNRSIGIATTKIAKVKEGSEKLKSQETSKVGEYNEVQVDERNLQFQKTQLMNSLISLDKRISDLVESINNKNKIPSYSVYEETIKELESVEKSLKDETLRFCLMKVGSDIVSPDSIKKNIISKVVDSINNMINANLSELCVGFTCNISQDMNDYTINSEGGELDFSILSLGERMKLLISSQLAFRKFLLSRFNVCANVMIIDEVVDRALDSVSIQKLLGMLLQLSQKENTNISIISHRGEVESMFNGMEDTQTLVIQKENNISRILV